jgi:uncharacterized membrane protein YgcG
MPRRTSICRILALAAAVTFPLALGAQERQLSWPSVAVDARLDDAGRLWVREVQRMRFTGDWNGGERSFRVFRGQDLTLDRVRRLRADGDTIDLVAGDLERVDEWSWTKNRVLRWRSRLPTDPPFDGAELTYILEYHYDGILQPDDPGVLLDHDFAFPDRSGDIDAFTLTLAIDSIWSPAAAFTGQFGPARLSPGEGFLVTLPLRYAGVGTPAGVFYGADAETRELLVQVLLAGLLAGFLRWIVRESRRGRFARPPALDVVTPEWLEREVFAMRPEVAGAAWDDQTAQAEVAATLSRLVQEGKLTSKVQTQKLWIFSSQTLELTITGARRDFNEYERALIDALFLPNEQTTDTDKVRARYKKTGFNPAAKIETGVNALVARLVPESAHTPWWRRADPWVFVALILTAVGFAVQAVREHPDDIEPLVLHVVLAGLLYAAALTQAYLTSRHVTRVMLHALRWLVPIALGLSILGPRILEGEPRLTSAAWAAITTLVLAFGLSVMDRAATRLSPQRIALRQRLDTAREWFRQELKRPEPALQDAWYPWLIAFGLGRAVDGWFKAFGGEETSVASSRSIGSVSAGSSSSGGWTGFGGGGGFSGGGSAGSFATAISGMAASVPAPSSSSGSGGSGGGSSGGGGGGGW